jgi:hypothetical protein
MMRQQQGVNCLGFYEEAVGIISGMTIDHGFLIVRIGKVNLVLPHEVEGKLCPLVGTRIGILHTDIPGKEYLVRIVTEKKYPVFDQIGEASLTEPKAQREKASA